MKFIFVLITLGLLGCQNPVKKAINETTYSAYELIGVQKRDLLKNRVEDTKKEQKEAGEDFEDALTKLKKVYSFNGGNLEKEYKSLKSSYDNAADQADDVHRSIAKVEDVANDLFKEWKKEIKQMETESLREKSEKSLRDTKLRFDSLHSSLKDSEERMDSVLRKFNDQVLYLKHNLNAKAIASLKGEAVSIEKDIDGLIKEMNKSIQSSDAFIQQMP
jgi:ElaB/YqjD/DUF883 family membrane-anchored ribosome-binding protein